MFIPLKPGKLKECIVVLVILWCSASALAQPPSWLWAKRAASPGLDGFNSVAVDGAGNTYVAGSFDGGTINLGSMSMTNSNGGAQVLIVKYDPSGNVVWAKNIGGSVHDHGFDIAVDAAGNSYVTGEFNSGTITIGTTTLSLVGGKDVFVLKLDPSGNLLWAKSAGGSAGDIGRSIALDASGNCYVTGEFNGGITFDNILLTNPGGQAIFVTKYDPSGNVVWAKKVTGTSGYGIAVDGSGNSYVTGWIGFNVIVVKLDPLGTVEWTQTAGISGFQIGRSIAVDARGNSYVTGFFQSGAIIFGSYILSNSGLDDAFVVKYDAYGNVVWAKVLGGPESDDGYGIAVDAGGNSYITGRYGIPALNFGNLPLPNAGNQDAFIAKFDPAGDLFWAKAVGGTSYDYGRAIAIDGSGVAYLAGMAQSTSVSFGSTVLSNLGEDAYVAKLDASCTLVQPGAITGSTASCTGSSQTYTLPTAPGATSYQWSLPPGWTGTSTTNSITTTVGANNGNITVSAVNVCGTSPVQILPVTADLPTTTPDTILGNRTPCVGDTLWYSVYPVWGATSYTWSLPSGWTGTQSINHISAVVGPVGGNITAAAVNACGASAVQTIPVTSLAPPAQPGPISGNNAPCSGYPETYSVPAVPGATSYNWTYPGWWSGSSTTNSIVLSSNIAGGNITVEAVNVCGTNVSQPLAVTVSPLPTPIVTQTGNTLSATPGFASYQWYLNGNPVPGATSQTHTATAGGGYYVKVTSAENCPGESAIINVVLGVEDVSQGTCLVVYPNPVMDMLHLDFAGCQQNAAVLHIYDHTGKMVHENAVAGNTAWMGLGHLPPGVYCLRVGTASIKLVKK